MRTTITLDDDLAAVLERQAKEKRVSFKQMINSTLRRGLAISTTEQRASAPKVVVRPFAGMQLRPEINPDKLLQHLDEMDAVTFVEKNTDWIRPS